MRLNEALPFLLIAMNIGACTRSTKGSSELHDDAVTPFPKESSLCPPGKEVTPFALVALASTPDISSLTFLGTTGFGSMPPAGFDGNMKLEVCFDPVTEDATLGRITYQDPTLSQSLMVIEPSDSVSELERKYDRVTMKTSFKVPRSSVVVTGLSSALFGETKGFSIEVPLDDQTVLMKGLSKGGVDFIAAGNAWKKAGVTQPNPLIVGTLEMHDPFPEGVCPSTHHFGEMRFQIGTAKIELATCYKEVGVSGSHYDILGAKVIDENPALDPKHRGERNIAREDVKGHVSWTITHHNECDSMRIALPGAIYAWTKSITHGCVNVVEDAPLVPDAVPGARLRAKVRYEELPWQEISVP